MVYSFDSGDFDVEYVESEIKKPIIWESHCHSQFEMIAVTEGDISVVLEGKKYRLKENQTLIIPPLRYHTVTANGNGIYRRVTVLFDLSAIPAVLRAEFEKCDSGLQITDSQTALRLRELFLKGNTDFYAPLMRSIMIEIFYEALERRERHIEIEADGFLEKALEYIDKHLFEKIALDDLARYTARSKSSFCHLFFEKMNISPKQYIIQKKLALAEKLIDGGMPRTEAAMRVGYSNYSDFYRAYKKKRNSRRESN